MRSSMALYSSPIIIRVLKVSIMRWAERVARMWRGEVHAGFWWINLREINHLKDLGVDGKIILKRIKTRVSMGWIDLVQD
jgi:hypothetical protein